MTLLADQVSAVDQSNLSLESLSGDAFLDIAAEAKANNIGSELVSF